ncbi:unnamed protein product [Blepharisma stoltei]|uniref:Major facilitator superfamily (MFS) profile domain-containing protein n=1 Tax=Blepharisma stoltei TaxID=1481888 RepID=A0AAU9IW69_9CILI|nr:unnamed protein product [Blepharisma stoltei]
MENTAYPVKFLVLIVILGTIVQTQQYLFGYIAAGSSMLDDTDTSLYEYGFLSGPTILLVNALLVLPIGRLVDYIKRPKWFVLSCSISICLITLLNSICENFYELLSVRLMFGIFACGISPTYMRLLALYFPSKKRGFASGFLFLTIYFGISLASLSLILAESVGWRWSYVLIGSISLVLTIIFGLFLRDIKNNAKLSRFTNEQILKSDILSLFKNKTLIFTILALFFQYISGFARSFYEAIYFAEKFSDNVDVYAVLNAIGILISPIAPILLGKYSDSKQDSDPKWQPLIIAITRFMYIPLLFPMYLSSNFAIAMLSMMLISTIGETYISVSYAILINVANPNVWAFQTAWMICVTTIAGTISTVIIGFYYTSLEALKVSLLIATVFGSAMAAIMFLVVAKFYPEDLKKQKECRKEIDEELVNQSEIAEELINQNESSIG